jgi:hypothetical protein
MLHTPFSLVSIVLLMLHTQFSPLIVIPPMLHTQFSPVNIIPSMRRTLFSPDSIIPPILLTHLQLNGVLIIRSVGRNSSVGVASRYSLDGPGMECRWGRDLRTRPDRPRVSLSVLYNGNAASFRAETRQDVVLTTHRHLAPKSKKEQKYVFTSPQGLYDLIRETLPVPLS